MGTSTVDLSGKGFWVRDGLLELCFLLIVREIDSRHDRQLWLKEAREHWYIQATVGFSGCISANLDQIIITEERRILLIDLCQAALLRLENPKVNTKSDLYVKSPPGSSMYYDDWLNDILGSLHENALYNLKKTGEQFLKLLRGELDIAISSTEAISWMSELKLVK